jgi:mRNA interferase RelE/StbE
MASYEIQISRTASRAIRSLPSDMRVRVVRAIDLLVSDARPPGTEKLRGFDRVYRMRVGQHRVIYEVDDESRLVRVIRVGHRRDVYRRL